MQYRRLGKSGLQVSELSFGSWLTFGKQIGDTTAKGLMQMAYDNGINFFDNAEIYSRGDSERVMGKLLQEFEWPRDTFLVSSKAYFGTGGRLPTQTGLHRKHLVEACEAAIQRLRVDYLDLFFCHRPDKQTPIEETVWTMHNLIQQGKILYWGTSEWSSSEIALAHAAAERYNLIGPTMEQPQYNMFVRQKVEEDFKMLYKNYGLGTTIWSPLGSGVLTGKYNDGMPEDTRLTMEGLDWLAEKSLLDEYLEKTRKLTAVAGELGISMARLALAWCLKNPDVSTVILGASKTSQLAENLKVPADITLLDDGVMAQIEDILQNKPIADPF